MNNISLIALIAALNLIICGCEPTGKTDTQTSHTVVSYPQFIAKNTMDEQEFWRLINSTHQQAQGDEQVQEKLLIKNLEKYEPAQIIEFECLLRQQIFDADNFKIMAAQKIIDGSVSDDSYLYFRCWLIGQGRDAFTKALHNPDSLADIDTEEVYPDFESLLYVATQAYHTKIGREEEDETFPRDVARARGLDYDGATQTKGEDWTEEQLPTLLPKLWAKNN